MGALGSGRDCVRLCATRRGPHVEAVESRLEDLIVIVLHRTHYLRRRRTRTRHKRASTPTPTVIDGLIDVE